VRFPPIHAISRSGSFRPKADVSAEDYIESPRASPTSSRMAPTPLSVLDLSPITQASDASASLRNSADLAAHVERLGYQRFWMAEHHSMPGIASAATAVALAFVGSQTTSIRI